MSISGTFETRSPDETVALAQRLGESCPGSSVIALHGQLGAGKTCFVQGLADALEIAVSVTSPTYTLVHEYGDAAQLVHMDLYRMRSPDELFTLGIEDYLEGGHLVAIEWPERAGGYLPENVINVTIEPGETDDARRITIS